MPNDSLMKARIQTKAVAPPLNLRNLLLNHSCSISKTNGQVIGWQNKSKLTHLESKIGSRIDTGLRN